MNSRFKWITCVGTMVLLASGGWLLWARPDAHLDADKIGAAAGTKATLTKDGVVRIAWAR